MIKRKFYFQKWNTQKTQKSHFPISFWSLAIILINSFDLGFFNYYAIVCIGFILIETVANIRRLIFIVSCNTRFTTISILMFRIHKQMVCIFDKLDCLAYYIDCVVSNGLFEKVYDPFVTLKPRNNLHIKMFIMQTMSEFNKNKTFLSVSFHRICLCGLTIESHIMHL